MTKKSALALVVLSDDHFKIAFGSLVAIYDKGGNLTSVVNPNGAKDIPDKLKVLDFRDGIKPSFAFEDIPIGLFL